MVPPIDENIPTTASNSPLLSQIVLGAVGGHGTIQAPAQAEVSSTEFKRALELSLSKAGYLAPTGITARYKLDAFLVEVAQRDAGPTFNVDAFVRYKMTDSSGLVLMQEIIQSETLANVGEIAAGGSAYMERAIRENILKLIQKLNFLGQRQKK